MACYNNSSVFVMAIAVIVGVAIPATLSKPLRVEGPKRVVSPTDMAASSLKNLQLDLVGTMDGKTFYSYTAQLVDWETASLICWQAEGGLRLAEVTSANQHRFLNEELFKNDGWYWTSAHDAQTEAQVVWASSRGPVARFGDEPVITGIRTAVSFHPASTTQAHFDLEALNIGNYVLCETV